MDCHQVISDIVNKYGEWLEMAGERSPALMNNILINLLVKEKAKVDFLEKKLKIFEEQ
jgi:hypothetical protein